MNKTTELQNLNDKLYELVNIIKRKQIYEEDLSLQTELLEQIASDMKDILTQNK